MVTPPNDFVTELQTGERDWVDEMVELDDYSNSDID